MRILKSKFHNKEWNNKKVISLPLSQLWPSVPRADELKGKPFYSRIKADIEQNGLHFPLIVVQADYDKVLQQKKKFNKGMSQPPSKTDYNGYTVWGGSNRFRIAEECCYDAVDIVIYDSFEQARKDQKLHRQPFQKFY